MINMPVHLRRFLQLICGFALFSGAAHIVYAVVEPPSESDALALATELGLSPEAIVVSGIAAHDSSFVVTILSRLKDAGAASAAMAELSAQVTDPGSQLTAAIANLRSKPHDPKSKSNFDEVSSDLALAQNQLEVVRQQLMEEALDGLSAALVSKVQAYAEASAYAVPPGFRSTARTEDEWKSIERALRAESRALRLNLPLDEKHALCLQAVRSETAVIQADYDLITHLDNVKSAFAHSEKE